MQVNPAGAAAALNCNAVIPGEAAPTRGRFPPGPLPGQQTAGFSTVHLAHG